MRRDRRRTREIQDVDVKTLDLADINQVSKTLVWISDPAATGLMLLWYFTDNNNVPGQYHNIFQ
jgi:hypothetical protein